MAKTTFTREDVTKLLTAMQLVHGGNQKVPGKNFGERAENLIKAYEATKGQTDEYTILGTVHNLKR